MKERGGGVEGTKQTLFSCKKERSQRYDGVRIRNKSQFMTAHVGSAVHLLPHCIELAHVVFTALGPRRCHERLRKKKIDYSQFEELDSLTDGWVCYLGTYFGSVSTNQSPVRILPGQILADHPRSNGVRRF